MAAHFVILLLALTGFGVALGQEKSSFQVEITTESGRALPPAGSFAFAGIEQTLVAKLTPAIEGVRLEWSIDSQAIRTYEHDIQDASQHQPVPLSAKDLQGREVKFFFTPPL